jgi:hypothetical protein
VENLELAQLDLFDAHGAFASSIAWPYRAAV